MDTICSLLENFAIGKYGQILKTYTGAETWIQLYGLFELSGIPRPEISVLKVFIHISTFYKAAVYQILNIRKKRIDSLFYTVTSIKRPRPPRERCPMMIFLMLPHLNLGFSTCKYCLYGLDPCLFSFPLRIYSTCTIARALVASLWHGSLALFLIGNLFVSYFLIFLKSIYYSSHADIYV